MFQFVSDLARFIESLFWHVCVMAKDDLQCRLTWADGSVSSLSYIITLVIVLGIFTSVFWYLLLLWERRRMRQAILESQQRRTYVENSLKRNREYLDNHRE